MTLGYREMLRRASTRGGAKKPRKREEDALHIGLVSILDDVLLPGVVMVHVPNQGHSTQRYIAKLKRMGMKFGAADLIFFRSGTAFFLELKSKTGRQRPKQETFQAEVEAEGFEYVIARTIDEAVLQLQKWGLISPKFKFSTIAG